MFRTVMVIVSVQVSSVGYSIIRYLLDWASVGYPGILFGGGSTNSVEDRGQTEGDLGAVAP